MKRFLPLLLIISVSAVGQSLQSINYNFQYDFQNPVSFQLKLYSVSKDSVQVAFQLTSIDTTQAPFQYSIAWSFYESLLDKHGETFIPEVLTSSHGAALRGTFKTARLKPILVAKIINTKSKLQWTYFKNVESYSLSDGYALNNNELIINYTTIPSEIFIHNQKSTSTVFYYQEIFPAASPPFVEAQGNVGSTWKSDSVFQIKSTFTPLRNGLFLVQGDSTTSNGLAFRAEVNYPKFSSLQNLVGPLTYITTKSEYDRLRNSQNDKKAFDKIILSITGNAERAKFFIRNYFKRVELANRYFTSYKEGWKTDRGMIFIVLGIPAFVYKFNDREIWEYRTLDNKKISFTFIRSSSVFDPDNYVLIRKASHQNIWLEAVDLNRNARF